MNPTMTTQHVRLTPGQVHEVLSRHMLADGFDFVLDLEKSEGSYLYDSRQNRRLLDFFSFFASNPIGMNHPGLKTPDFQQRILRAAVHNPTNSDVYTVEMAEFVETFGRIAKPEYLPYAFFVDGGALAVENALAGAGWPVVRRTTLRPIHPR